MNIVEGSTDDILQSQITNCLKRIRNDDDESIKREVSDLMLKNKTVTEATSLEKIRNINGKFVCIVVTVFIMNKFSGISIYNTYIGNVFLRNSTTLETLTNF